MVEEKTNSASRYDLRIDESRCLKMRFSDSSCTRCVGICPHGAVTLDGFLAVNPNHCRGCLLCTTVCPSGALEQRSDFSGCLAQLSRVAQPVLGCGRAKRSNAALACLGALSEEHLLALCHSLAGTLILNLTACGDCRNNLMVFYLRRRCADLSEGGFFEGGCRIVIAESAQDVQFHDESVDRRVFFKTLRSSLFQVATLILSAGNEQPECCTEYAVKRLPARRELLNRTTFRLSPEIARLVHDRFGHQAYISDCCTTCQGCVAICPSGALLTDSPDARPRFDGQCCTGCGLCGEFCLDGAVAVISG